MGSRVDVERRCEPSCQEFDGNKKTKYIIDRVSCCTGNLCNAEQSLNSQPKHIIFTFLVFNIISFQINNQDFF